MKTQLNKKLKFNKNVVTELNSATLRIVYGGSDIGLGDETVATIKFTSDFCKRTGTNGEL